MYITTISKVVMIVSVTMSVCVLTCVGHSFIDWVPGEVQIILVKY